MKVVIIIRKDIKMPIGKAIAQAVHSVHNLKYHKTSAVVILRANNKEHLQSLIKEYNGHAVIDAAHTVFKEPTLTCAAFLCEDNAFKDLSLY